MVRLEKKIQALCRGHGQREFCLAFSFSSRNLRNVEDGMNRSLGRVTLLELAFNIVLGHISEGNSGPGPSEWLQGVGTGKRMTVPKLGTRAGRASKESGDKPKGAYVSNSQSGIRSVSCRRQQCSAKENRPVIVQAEAAGQEPSSCSWCAPSKRVRHDANGWCPPRNTRANGGAPKGSTPRSLQHKNVLGLRSVQNSPQAANGAVQLRCIKGKIGRTPR